MKINKSTEHGGKEISPKLLASKSLKYGPPIDTDRIPRFTTMQNTTCPDSPLLNESPHARMSRIFWTAEEVIAPCVVPYERREKTCSVRRERTPELPLRARERPTHFDRSGRVAFFHPAVLECPKL